MLRNIIILFPFFVVGYVSGQAFTEVPTNIDENSTTSISWGDYDNDNDLDVLVSGSSYTRIYRNSGSGVFTNINAGVADIMIWASSDWGDYDNDGDIDLVLAGKPTDYTSVTYIYRNDNGVFTDIHAELQGFGRGSAEWGDYDNDGDLDLLMCGEDEKLDASTRIYINRGDDEFTLADKWLPGISRGSAAWGDYDNDHDLDILICGRDISGNSISAVYRNDGDQFTDIEEDLQTIQEGTGIWGDYDADGDLDIFISGKGYSIVYENINNHFADINADIFGLNYTKASWGDFDHNGLLDLLIAGSFTGGKITTVYKYNYGIGFTLYDSSFTKITYGDVKCADYDNDNDLDLVLAGYTDPWVQTANQYRNNIAIANTAPSIPTNLNAKTEGSSVILSWSGSSDSKTPSRGISYNIRIGNTSGGIQVVSPMSDLSTGIRRIASSGNASSDTSWVIKNLPKGKYYWSVQAIDNGYLASSFASEGIFTVPVPFTDMRSYESLDSVFRGSVAWGDYDNDHDLDLAITGVYEWKVVSGQPKDIKSMAKIYRNDSNTDFTEVLNFLGGLYHSISKWGDYDNDGDLDLLMTGEQLLNIEQNDTTIQKDTTIAMIYQNLGKDNFEKLDVNLKAICQGTGLWTDFDNDGDLDILFAGASHENYSLTTIYRNDGNHIFVETDPGIANCRYNSQTTCFDADSDGDIDILHFCNGTRLYKNSSNLLFNETEMNLPDILAGFSSYGDYDNDRDLDLLLAGREDITYTKLFNNKNGTFNEIKGNFRGVTHGSSCWGDYDVDGDLDLLLSGQSGRGISFIYLNEGSNYMFTEFDPGLSGVHLSDAQWGDYDNDGDLDIVLNGVGGQGFATKIYRNNGNWQNAPPLTPDNLQYEFRGFDVLLKWDHCTDGDGMGGVTYNVRIDTVPGKGSLTSAMSDLNTGYRLLPEPGNAGVNNFYLVKNLPFNTYYWSVQAIDNTYKGGSWAKESSFELGNVFVDFEFDTVCFGNQTKFNDLSLSREGSILSWYWDFGDGGISNEQNPQYYFPQPGEMNVKLTIVLETGSYFKTKKVLIKSKPRAQFAFEPVSEGGEVMLFENQTDTFGVSVVEWIWDFGDSTEFIGKNPPQHGYLSTATYTVKLSVTSSNGCSDSISEDVQVCHGMLKKPELRAYGPNTWYMVCSNDSAAFYKWYYDGNQIFNESSYIHVANKKLGEYQVSISSDDECYVSSDRVWIPVTGLSTNESDEFIRIYPNPNDGYFKIHALNEDISNYSYRLIDVLGKEFSSGKIKNENNKGILFKYDHLKDGIYIIEIYNDQTKIYSNKIVIKKQ